MKIFLLCAGIFAILSIFLQFFLTGYQFTAALSAGAAVFFLLFAFLSSRKTPAAKWLRVSLLLLLAIGFGCFLAAEIPVLSDSRSDKDTHAPCLIVCGAGVNGSIPSRSLLDRLQEAKLWLDENPESTAVLSGSQGPGEDISEAQAMYEWLTAQGIAPQRLFMEENAKSSYDNIANSLLILRENMTSVQKVAILSSDYHLHRLRCIAEKLGAEPVMVSARTSIYSLFLNYAIRESFAMWKFWLFGT